MFAMTLLFAQTPVWVQIKTANIKKIFLSFIFVSFRQFRCVDAVNIKR